MTLISELIHPSAVQCSISTRVQNYLLSSSPQLAPCSMPWKELRDRRDHWSRLTWELSLPEKSLFCVTTAPNPLHNTKLLSFVSSIQKSSSAVKILPPSALQKDVMKQFNQFMKYSIFSSQILNKFFKSLSV